MTGRCAGVLCLLLVLGLHPRRLLAAGLVYTPEPKELAARAPDDMQACSKAAGAAEQNEGLPPGLLLAIGQQESGRWDTVTRAVQPWPYATNAAGEGRFFQSGAEAITYVTSQLRFGVQSIDVGCFQINLRHHPNAFATLQEAFDPDTNARYAAHFLKALYSETGSWEAAVGRYHSATAALGDSYKAAVLGRWTGRGSVVPSVSSRSVVPSASSRGTPGVEVIAGVIVQRPLVSAAQVNIVVSIAGLPRVITPGGGLSRRM